VETFTGAFGGEDGSAALPNGAALSYRTCMRNAVEWQPTKFVSKRGRLQATHDTQQLHVASRLMAELIAAAYDQALKVHATGRLLDMGCGKVPLYEGYRPYVSEIQCIDWPSSPHGCEFLDKVCDLADHIPYPDESFDTIILSDVLEHLPEPMHCWREMNRLLAPAGKVLLNAPFYYQVHEAPHDFYRYTEFALRRFADESGFAVLELRNLGGAAETYADLTSKLLASVKLGWVAAALQSAASAFSKSRWGVRLSERTGERFPLAYFMIAQKVEPCPNLDSYFRSLRE
jgi:SAM-dependent methyltransferase